MKNPTRITVAFDDKTLGLFNKARNETGLSQSELLRQALRFYCENRNTLGSSTSRKLSYYLDMLPQGEHVILDVDHWLLFLGLIESSPEKDAFWEDCQRIAKSHAEQLMHKIHSIDDLLERLEACNFFRVTKNSEKDFTLVLGSEVSKKFVKTFLKEFCSAGGFKIEIKEDLAKMRIVVSGSA